jgi:hypothetical protein
VNPGHPEKDEYVAFYAGYIAKAQAVADPLISLETQLGETLALLRPLNETQQAHRYAEGKCSVKEVVKYYRWGTDFLLSCFAGGKER